MCRCMASDDVDAAAPVVAGHVAYTPLHAP